MTEVLNNQVTVGTTPTVLVAPKPAGQQVIIANRHATAAMWVGNSAVTTANGVEVKAGEKLANAAIELPPETELYGIAASGTVRVDVFSLVGD